ncbi:hypothetical protein VTJ83DRAFT_5040 [Remersonia thermophila]|uniref:Uncharacterized protein n=1 Tax=Remersonia thermophila TaxID=72144 RepID=A0ABR4DBQ0_9PEZI
MGGSQPPYLYEPVKRDDERFPETPFDPKAVTRASYEEKKPRPKPEGPLISANRHPDLHEVLPGRDTFKPMSPRTKGLIKAVRVVQLCLRVPEAIAAAGLIIVMIVAGLMSGFFAWVMSTTLGVAIIHCGYSIYHHSRPAGLKPPRSSAAYHFFSAALDLLIPPLYAYGAYTTRRRWDDGRANPQLAETTKVKYALPSLHYSLIAAGGLHLLSMGIALWLAMTYRRIAKMPPDMNPLEPKFTSRVTVQKRDKSSVVISFTSYADIKRDSEQLYDDPDSPRRSIPFIHTRQGSEVTVGGASNHSRIINLPNRQYQITPGNGAPASSRKSERMSAPPSVSHGGASSYTDIPLSKTATNSSSAVTSWPPPSTPNLPRPARFTETWYASDSLINRTQQRNRKSHQSAKKSTAAAATTTTANNNHNHPRRSAYTTLDASSSDNDSDHDSFYSPAPIGPVRGSSLCTNSIDNGSDSDNPAVHPLRSHPSNYGMAAVMTPPATTDDDETSNTENRNPAGNANDKDKKPAQRRKGTPFSHIRTSRILTDVTVNDRHHPALIGSRDDNDDDNDNYYDDYYDDYQDQNDAAGNERDRNREREREQEQDIADMKNHGGGGGGGGGTLKVPKKRHSLFPPRHRLSSIQADADFLAKPYGELKPGTPPIMIGPAGKEMRHSMGAAPTTTTTRQVSGCDYGDLGGGGEMGRRRVSARAAEEGRAYGF